MKLSINLKSTIIKNLPEFISTTLVDEKEKEHLDGTLLIE